MPLPATPPRGSARVTAFCLARPWGLPPQQSYERLLAIVRSPGRKFAAIEGAFMALAPPCRQKIAGLTAWNKACSQRGDWSGTGAQPHPLAPSQANRCHRKARKMRVAVRQGLGTPPQRARRPMNSYRRPRTRASGGRSAWLCFSPEVDWGHCADCWRLGSLPASSILWQGWTPESPWPSTTVAQPQGAYGH